jgi:hypothetical protein
MPDRPESDPLRHTQQARERLDDLIEHLRADVKKVEDPQAKALFETAAETLGGLREAFADYEEGDEAAWEGQ